MNKKQSRQGQTTESHRPVKKGVNQRDVERAVDWTVCLCSHLKPEKSRRCQDKGGERTSERAPCTLTKNACKSDERLER